MSGTTSVAFYIGAHQDDWQLFMSPQAYDDLVNPGTKVVFVYTTFGEAGDRLWGKGRSAGAISSIQFALHQRIAPLTPEWVEVNAHIIEHYTLANTRSYYLNLPDGNGDGNGFATMGNQSIQKLYDTTLPAISSVVDDPAHTAHYVSWLDLVLTLRQIVEQELAGEDDTPYWVHYLDPRATKHSDHTVTGYAVQEAFAGDTRVQHAMYEEYITPSKPANVTAETLVHKAGLYLFYAQTAFEVSGRLDQFDEWHISFVPRQYRVE